jgi:hypothetical protein
VNGGLGFEKAMRMKGGKPDRCQSSAQSLKIERLTQSETVINQLTETQLLFHGQSRGFGSRGMNQTPQSFRRKRNRFFSFKYQILNIGSRYRDEARNAISCDFTGDPLRNSSIRSFDESRQTFL